MAKDKKNKKTTAPKPSTMPPSMSTGAGISYSQGVDTLNNTTNNSYSYNSTMTTTTTKKTTATKSKKGKKINDPLSGPGQQPNISSLSPEQINQMQLEEAIKESQNPALKLRKLRSPLSVRSCLLNLLIFVVFTLLLVYLYIWIFKVDIFNIGVITSDILQEYGISKFFSDLFTRIANLFTGKGWTLSLLR